MQPKQNTPGEQPGVFQAHDSFRQANMSSMQKVAIITGASPFVTGEILPVDGGQSAGH
jgi:hypothetical protein